MPATARAPSPPPSLLLAVGGTSALGLHYGQPAQRTTSSPWSFGLLVVVILWAILIASTPQVVSLRGSVLTIHNSGGTERFDLADGLTPVDVVGDPRSSHWALLLHRANTTRWSWAGATSTPASSTRSSATTALAERRTPTASPLQPLTQRPPAIRTGRGSRHARPRRRPG